MQLVIEAKIARRQSNRRYPLRVSVTNSAIFSGLRAVMAGQTGFFLGKLVVLRGRTGERGGVTGFASGCPARQVPSMRENQVLAGGHAKSMRKQGRRDSQPESQF
jgi:hypothetical protein